jgi:flagellar hook assembly protein FlgD
VTTISFDLPHASGVRLRIYDVAGRMVRLLIDDRPHEAGRYSVRWDGSNHNGRRVSSGVYFYRLDAGSYSKVRRMVVVK